MFISFYLQFEGVHRRKRKNRSSYPRPRQEKQPLGGERKMSNYVIRHLPSERSSPFFLCCTTSTNRTDVWFIKAYGDNRLTKKKKKVWKTTAARTAAKFIMCETSISSSFASGEKKLEAQTVLFRNGFWMFDVHFYFSWNMNSFILCACVKYCIIHQL